MQPDTAVMEPEQNLPAERPQHPIISQIDAKMPQIAEMLPEGMSADRFRRVVVQALVRNPDLWTCTPVSVVSAIVESAQLGLEPTGVLGRAWMLPYSVKGTKEAKLIVGYRGYSELAWRADRILVKTGAVRHGDDFAYQRGTDAFLRHIPGSDDPEREATDANISDFWALYQLPDGRTEFEVMSRKAVERIRDKARFKNPVWDSDFGEMGRKTVLRRLLKVAPLSPEVQRVLGRDEEIDFDTPVERVPDPKRDDLRDRISQRTAAMRGESFGESDASLATGGAVPEDERSQAASSGGSPKGDPWMRRLHAVANERGMDHDALHDWAVQHFRVQSLTDLTTSQRATFMELVERMPVIEQPQHSEATDGALPEAPGAAVDGAGVARTPAPTTRSTEGSPASAAGSEAATAQATVPPGEPAPAPSADELIRSAADVTGGEVIEEPPAPGTDEYKALPAAQKAAARAYHSKPPEQETLAAALGAELAE